MEKTETLKDGTKVTVRKVQPNDLDKLMKFYKGLPLEDRKYLRFDVTDKKIVTKRLKRTESGDDIRIAALHNGEFVASGVIELSGLAWSKHQGEIRVMVARPFQHRGLGMIMIRELFFIAVQNNLEVINAMMMRPQVGAQHIFRKLGFREEMLLPDYLKDLEGVTQDMIIMTCNVKELWKQLDHLFSESDWQRCR
jgi:ribosomal protein S18 acetylase RimI-like enzyme